MFDLSRDPQELFNLDKTAETNGWIFEPLYREIEKHEESVKKYPNIKPGEDFKGYAQSRSAISEH